MSREIVHVIATFVAAPGKEDELEAVLVTLVEPTRREAGCLRYDLVRGHGQSAEFAFIEEWESLAHLEAHSQTDHLRAVQGRVAPLLASAVSIERYRRVR
jgi:quinol monooxygenase YgiN